MLSKAGAGIFAATFIVNLASAHPGHDVTNVAAEVSQPLAGADHLFAFVALTSTLLFALRLILKARDKKVLPAKQISR
jgi:hydrogenase/urease accessory protein HupE